MTYTECPNCGYEDVDSEELGIVDNGSGTAQCLNCGWLESEVSHE